MANSISEVVAELDAIINEALEQRSPLGYFPALYRRVTIAVKRAIEQSAFDDNERMERLDVVFANRYLDAYRCYQAQTDLTQSWETAFAFSKTKLTTLQHLLLGMNAHISLDLGIAAASVADPRKPLSLKNDFYQINHILGSLIDDTQSRLTRIFGPLDLADKLLGSIDESLSLFSISYARDKAWTQTLELLLADGQSRPSLIADRDQSVSRFANCLARPNKLSIRLLLAFVRLLERGDISSRIRIMQAD